MKALPKKLGTISGLCVSIQPRFFMITKVGMTVIAPGIIIVASRMEKISSLPRKCIRAKAKPASEEEMPMPITESDGDFKAVEQVLFPSGPGRTGQRNSWGRTGRG